MQTKLKNFVILLCLAVQLRTIEAGQYLAQKPDFLTPCHLGDSSFNQCFAKNFENIFHFWKDGIPGLKSVGPLDPLHIKRIKFAQNGNEALELNAELLDVQVRGTSLAIFKDARYDPATAVANLVVHAPKLRFDFDYKVKGHITAIPLDSQGKGYFEAENVVFDGVLILTPRHEGDLIFTDIKNLQAQIKKIGGFHMQLNNLFTDKNLEQTVNALVNENWQQFSEILRPTIEETANKYLGDRFKKILSYVPANYLVDNLP